MQLAEAGKVDLDAPVQRYIPWFRVADLEASTLITVRHLLNQTSGLTEGAGRAATLAAGMHLLEPAVRALATTRLARPPGAAFEYSNLNYTTLGLVVEMAAGEPFEVYLKRHIFEPLDMHHTCTDIEDAQGDGLASGYRYWFGFPVAFHTPGHGGTVPAGGILSTAEDMSRYLAMYQGGGRYHGQVLLAPAGIAEMMQPGPPQKRGAFAGAGYGMGWVYRPLGRGARVLSFRRRTRRSCRHDPGPARELGRRRAVQRRYPRRRVARAAGDRAKRVRDGGRRDSQRHRYRRLLRRVRRRRSRPPWRPRDGRWRGWPGGPALRRRVAAGPCRCCGSSVSRQP